MILIANVMECEKHITAQQVDNVYRARSVKYSLNGNAHEDVLGAAKKRLRLTFSLCPQSFWELLKGRIAQFTNSGEPIVISGSIGSLDISGNYRLADNTLPTPVTVVIGGAYYIGSAVLTFEEI